MTVIDLRVLQEVLFQMINSFLSSAYYVISKAKSFINGSFFSCRYICLHMHGLHMYMYSNVFLRPSSDLEFFLNTVTYAKEDVH